MAFRSLQPNSDVWWGRLLQDNAFGALQKLFFYLIKRSLGQFVLLNSGGEVGEFYLKIEIFSVHQTSSFCYYRVIRGN